MLTAVDTNIILRDILRDDPVQSQIAAHIMEDGDILIVATVLAETEWVLRSVYKWPREQIHHVLRSLINIENVVTDDDVRIRWAIARYGAGADLADMLHVAGSHIADKFVTFDRRLELGAANESDVPIETVGLLT